MTPWFRWYRGCISDVKFRMVAMDASAAVCPNHDPDDAPINICLVIAIWATLLERTESDGTVTVTKRNSAERNGEGIIRYVSAALGLSEKTVTAVINALLDYGLLDPEDRGYRVRKWVERQSFNTTGAERQKRYRERNASVTSRVTSPLRSRDSTVTGTKHSRTEHSRTDKKENKIGASAPQKTVPKKEEIISALKTSLDDERAQAVYEHRVTLRKPLSLRAAVLLARQFAEAPDPNAAADEMLARGWTGFKFQWMLNNRSQQAKQMSRTQRASLELIEEADSNGNIIPFGRPSLCDESSQYVNGELCAAAIGSQVLPAAIDNSLHGKAEGNFEADG